jgi:hypothetical protein
MNARAIVRSLLAAFCVAAPITFAQAQTPTPQVSGHIVTSGASRALGQRIAVQNFTTDDYVISYVDLQWSPADTNAGAHFVEHRWLRDGTLVSDGKRVLAFNQTPFTLSSRRAAATLGTGHFTIQTLVDNAIVATDEFDIGN